MNLLNDLQLDALTETINLGIGNAASALSQMVNEEIILSVPQISFVSKNDAISLLNKNENLSVSAVSQDFDGPFNGKALLLFPVSKSLELVRLMLQDTVPMDELTEFEEEALNEIGNIILNSGLSSISDIFGEEITSGLPIFSQGHCETVINDKQSDNADVVLFLHVAFNIESKNIDGYVVYLLDLDSIDNLAAKIDRYLEKIG